MTQYFIGLAAPRCGSTWLWRQLRDHPQVGAPTPKELGWYDRPNKHSLTGDGHYKRLIDAQRGRAKGEFTPGYVLCAPEAYQHMAELLPDVVFFGVFRHPVERTLSHCRFLARNFDDPVDWDDALTERVLCRSRYVDFKRRLEASGLAYRMLWLKTERMFADPAKELAPLWDHIGVDAGKTHPETSVNRTKPEEAPDWLVERLTDELADDIALWESL